MSSAAPFTMAMDFVPDGGHRSFHGTVTITKTTLTVFKTNSSATTAMRDPATNERSTFIGVCSIPLIQFYRHKNVVTLMRGSSFLFDNAAVTAGLRGTDSAIRSGSRHDNPTMWESLQMKCDSLNDCDKIVDVLLSRNAEETFRPPPPPQDAESTASSVDSYSRHNEHRHRSSSSRHNSPRRHAATAGGDSHRERSGSAHHTASTRGPTPHNGRSAPQTDVSTPRSSRLPSRRENDDTATQLSTRTDVSTPRSSRLPSRRENDDVTSVTMTTPSQSIRSSQQRVAPGRSATNTVPTSASHTPVHRSSPSKRTHSSERRTLDASPRSAASSGQRRTHSTTHARVIDPTEREFAAETRPRSNGHDRRSPHQHRSSSSGGAAAAAARPASARSPHSHSASRRHGSPRTDVVDYSASVSPRSTVSRRNKTEQDLFMRGVQKLQHHRLHFMQYLHKEMVHQAYLAEEAKIKGAMAAAAAGLNVSPSRQRNGGGSAHTSPSRRASEAKTAAEEAARLREIESRLAQVEALHREAEREREEAARLRREFEWKTEELNARLGSHPMADGSRGVSVNSSVIAPQRNSSAYASGQLMVVPQNGGGSSYPVMPHPGYHSSSSAEWALINDPAAAPRPDDVDLGTAIIDRYVFGEEWARVYPAYEADIRFNAQIDVCLAMKLPRRLVTITNLVVDRPGLRVTAEIRYDRVKIERDGVERRMNGCPFRFLQRFYDMRDLYDPMHDGAAALTGRQPGSATPRALAMTAANPTASSRRSSRALSTQRRRPGHRHASNASDVSADVDAEEMREHYQTRMEDRVRAAEDRLAKKRRRMLSDLRHQLADNIAQLLHEEEYARDNIDYAQAKAHQQITRDFHSKVKATLTSSIAHLAEDEHVERAAIEVGAARQLHVLLGGHRRKLAVLGLLASEAERRRQIASQEVLARGDLNTTMNPSWTAQRKDLERRARGEELRASHERMSHEKFEAAVGDLVSDEIADRAVIRSQAMAELLDLLYRSPAPIQRDGRRAPSSIHGATTMRALLAELVAEEADGRRQLVADEKRRRALYQQDEVQKREMVERVRIEGAELDARDGILDGLLAQNREQLERRLSEREQLTSLLNEEQFYRRTILSDEQDAFEVIAELFAAGLKDILAHVPENDDDDEDLRRRRVSTQRSAKPFHYMTFSPEDMDYPPSAVLAIEGIVGCSINKNLEVVSVARPLPKAEEEDLQLQAGDMILDVAGHSLHSLSHLREVLSNRAMQIQEEALQEFPDVPEEERTVNPALQKYIEMLCEHHNFLVQVLRGCDIYQIIVRS